MPRSSFHTFVVRSYRTKRRSRRHYKPQHISKSTSSIPVSEKQRDAVIYTELTREMPNVLAADVCQYAKDEVGTKCKAKDFYLHGDRCEVAKDGSFTFKDFKDPPFLLRISVASKTEITTPYGVFESLTFDDAKRDCLHWFEEGHIFGTCVHGTTYMYTVLFPSVYHITELSGKLKDPSMQVFVCELSY